MTRFNIRIALLALGVLFGYGSAIAHYGGHRHHSHHRCEGTKL
jgi:hypothetical protein